MCHCDLKKALRENPLVQALKDCRVKANNIELEVS